MRGWIVAAALAVGLAGAGVAGAVESAPGVVVRLYDIGEEVRAIPDIMAGQRPNVAKIVPTLDLSTERKDFEPLTEWFVTEVAGDLNIEKAGLHMFRLISDDGARLWIDDREIIDNDGLHGVTPKDSQPLHLPAGPHKLRIWHLQGGGAGQLTLQWIAPRGPANEFAAIPATALSHVTDASLETTAGKKRFVAGLRRGRPGDGRPVTGPHRGFGLAPAASQPAPESDLTVVDGWLRPAKSDAQPAAISEVWIPSDDGRPVSGPVFALPASPLSGQKLVPGALESKRVFLEPVDEAGKLWQGCALRFAAGHALPAATSDKVVFEVFRVQAMSDGLLVEFTRPLDPRVGWEADSYYVEQWPFDVAQGILPHRDGVVYPVAAAHVTAERNRVFLEIPGLNLNHVVYLRLLPPCVSEDGELPWSTEVWFTLRGIPENRPGPRPPRPAPVAQNNLTDEEKQAGWRLLFDGTSTRGWHGYKKDVVPDGWKVVEGCLVRVGPGGDIATDGEFDDFELALEWRIAAAGNSGIFFRVNEEYKWPWESGPEMQVLDNVEHPDGRDPKTSAGSNYALHAPARDVTQPVGLFNKARILVRGKHVEYWMNDKKTVEYELGSPEWEQLVAASKFKAMPHYGREPKGRIVLQDHGDKVWYRNIKIRTLSGD